MVVHSAPARRAIHKPRQGVRFSAGRTAPLDPAALLRRFPCIPVNDMRMHILKKLPFFGRVFLVLLGFERRFIGAEIDGMGRLLSTPFLTFV